MTFAAALLKLHLSALDQFGVKPDAIDAGLAEDGVTAVLTAHIGDEGLAVGFDPKGVAIEAYREALNHPTKIFVPNGRVLRDHELPAFLRGGGDARTRNS